ncbi:Anti-anti-sigma regulatory factor (antagonist of anti-sigma factor) [Mycobacterium tuberculosis GuangZ0019]|uniref:Anti-sigma factor antagonist n=1 Tax=Mycobacterium tuberculosis TaxID=1773 RepID=A0A654ZZF0_MYCTX|nr:Anti-anti-sigma regulatory factor (antagonist of anti-sigma factor) [Mycobacterium tuberculosis GuangZ0019]EQM19993.1 Anti-anti-sigma regulatory factor (antagonist of anti-sigma factor) [Mycobacterium tuberculosis FJ05194]KXN96305.1 STAS domain protein [Mycobacterium tuberculosis]CKR81100.1 anti-anti-sigma factor RsfA [Mycobacterium tuberculosis]CNV63718.1 anti-anti-sigma factor RsfA [Mycobacterium tuberculosis]
MSNALKATIQHHDSAVIIHARGEIDAANEHTWQDLVTKAAAATTAPEPLVVNLNGLDFMGCCAVAVLAHEAERCRRRGVDVRLVSRDRAVARIIHACGYGDVLPVHPTTESALSAT